MTHPSSEERGHKCFGCQKQIADMEPHIHFTLDEWAAHEGLSDLGLGDLLALTMCESCTQKSERGWQPEAHAIEGQP